MPTRLQEKLRDSTTSTSGRLRKQKRRRRRNGHGVGGQNQSPQIAMWERRKVTKWGIGVGSYSIISGWRSTTHASLRYMRSMSLRLIRVIPGLGLQRE